MCFIKKDAIETNPFDHIIYEFQMYMNTYHICCGKCKKKDQLIINMAWDSHMIHLRNLAYFFNGTEVNNKNYFHYQMFISIQLTKEIDRVLYSEIQRITSNATCHILKGRLNEKMKETTRKKVQEVFPEFSSLIAEFIKEANDGNVTSEYSAQWNDERIRRIVKKLSKELTDES